MTAWLGLSVFPLILVVLVLVAMVFRVRQGGRRERVLVYRPRRHGLIARISFAVLGLSAFAGVGFSTWQEIHSGYGRIHELSSPEAGPAVAESRKVKVPTAVLQPPPPGAPRDIEKPDICAYVVVAQEVGGTMVTRQIEPMGSLARFFGGGQAISDFRILGRDCEIRVNPLRAWWEAQGGESTSPTLKLHASITGRIFLNSDMERGVSYGGLEFPSIPICRFMAPQATTRLVSLERAIPAKFQLWLVGIAAEPGCGEKEIDAATFVSTYGRDLYGKSPVLIGPRYEDSQYQRVSVKVPGLALIVTKGVAAVALLMAALLLAEVFRRRLVAAAILATLVVLYIAAWDRYGLGVHLSHMEDKSASLAVRLRACENTHLTYFYRKTARKGLDRIAHDPVAPKKLQAGAARTLSWLQTGP